MKNNFFQQRQKDSEFKHIFGVKNIYIQGFDISFDLTFFKWVTFDRFLMICNKFGMCQEHSDDKYWCTRHMIFYSMTKEHKLFIT